MDFNWRGAAEGALGGYQMLLQQKMKEEYEQRIEEAQMNRQMNLEKYRYSMTEPDREYARTYQQGRDKVLDQRANQDYSLREQEAKARREEAQAAAADRDANRQIAAGHLSLAQERAKKEDEYRKNEGTRQIDQLKALEEAKSELRQKEVKDFADRAASRIDDPEKAQAMRDLIIANEFTSPEDIRKMKTENPEYLKKSLDVRADAIKETSKALESMEQEDIIERATSSGWRGKGNPREFLLAAAGQEATRAFAVQSSVNIDSTTPSSTKNPKETKQQSAPDLSTFILPPTQKAILGEKALLGDQNAIDTLGELRSKNPEEYSKIKGWMNKNEERILRRKREEEEDVKRRASLYQRQQSALRDQRNELINPTRPGM